MSNPAPPPPSETKLSEALDKYEQAVIETHASGNPRYGKNARSSLESLYRELLDEMETLALAVRVVNEELLDAKAKLDYQQSEDAAYDLEEMLTLSAEVGRLRSTSLLLARLAADTPQFDSPIEVWEAKKLRDKILRISSKATSEEL